MTQADVLAIIAHPDDETFVSGTLCLLADRGFRTVLIVATAGEGGARALCEHPPGGDRDLADIRRGELALSAWALGVSEIVQLDQPDIDPSKWRQGAWDDETVINRLAQMILANRPRLILTHGPQGGYGHPAHKHAFHCVAEAAKRAGYAGSLFSFAARPKGAFITWFLDQPADVRIDARRYARRRAASLSYHQTQADVFTRPEPPRTLRQFVAEALGVLCFFHEASRKRFPLRSAADFVRMTPFEGLAQQDGAPTHFFHENFSGDPRVKTDLRAPTRRGAS